MQPKLLFAALLSLYVTIAHAQVVPVMITIASAYGGAGGRHPLGTALNESSQVVGSWGSAFVPYAIPFTWTQSDGMTSVFDYDRWFTAEPIALSDSGRMVGRYWDNAWTGFHPFTWTAEDGAVEIPITGAGLTLAVNDRDQVVGVYGGFGGDPTRLFSWTEPTGVVEVASFDGASIDLLTLGDDGRIQLVGTRWVEAGGAWTCRLFSWTPAGGTTEIGDGGDRCSMVPVAMNVAGHVVGTESDGSSPPGYQQAFSWTAEGGFGYLGTLGGLLSSANALNDGGQVAGASTLPDGTSHPFLWSRERGMSDLGLLPGGLSGEAIAVSDRGQVIGTNQMSDGSTHAFSWTSETGMLDLGSCRWGWVVAVNNSGRILGNCEDDWRPYFGPRLFKTDPIAEMGLLAGEVVVVARSFGIATSLTMKLRAAASAYRSGNVAASCDVLGSFIGEVMDLPASKITEATAQALARDADDIGTMLQCEFQ